MEKAYFNWSSGKDSAFALYTVLSDNSFQVEYLVTTINASKNRVSMHGLSFDLLQKQVDAIGIPLHCIHLPENPSMEEYENNMLNAVSTLKGKGLTNALFGDLFLEDLKKYREQQLIQVGIKAHFPLWKKNTATLALELINQGFKAIIVCVDGRKLDKSFVGRIFDHSFINDLPDNVDPCGENGEFHTFVFDAPFFNYPVDFQIGEKISIPVPVPNDPSICSTDNMQQEAFELHYIDLI